MRHFGIAAWIVAVAVSSAWAKTETPAYGDRGCTSAREFVVTLEYLRSVKEFALPEAEARRLAEAVAAGCTHAGRRFVLVAQTLLKAGMKGPEALKLASELALRTEGEARAFVGIFRMAFLEDGLDLDMPSSVRMARELSLEFKGEASWAHEDFRRIVEFCVKGRGLDLPRPVCGQLAARIAKKAEVVNGGIANDFMKAFQFSVDPKIGPGMTTAQALATAEEVALSGPDAVENLIAAYRYAIREKGLGLPVDDAFKFAKRMALTLPDATKTRN